MTGNRSGVAVGAENRDRLAAYFDGLRRDGGKLPSRCGGRPNVQAIALAASVDRQVLYKNPKAVRMLSVAVAEFGLEAAGPEDARQPSSPASDEAVELQRRLAKLENENLRFSQRNSALQAEVLDLRARLRRFEHMESHMTDTGRRVIR